MRYLDEPLVVTQVTVFVHNESSVLLTDFSQLQQRRHGKLELVNLVVVVVGLHLVNHGLANLAALPCRSPTNLVNLRLQRCKARQRIPHKVRADQKIEYLKPPKVISNPHITVTCTPRNAPTSVSQTLSVLLPNKRKKTTGFALVGSALLTNRRCCLDGPIERSHP